jgi:hypothetical protein|tara:strand:- start:3137 stop:4351 length:1215 start_codon:yes stop_codon:yes gene_type:complete
MLNNKTTHNPNGNIVWSDSPNSIFKLAYLSEEDIKYYCFGDGGDGGDSDAVDAASDMGIASANAPDDAFSGEDAVPGATDRATALANPEFVGPLENFEQTPFSNELTKAGMHDMVGFGTVSRTQGMEAAPEAFTPGFSILGFNTGLGRGPLGSFTSTNEAVNAADDAAGFGESDVGSFDPFGFATGLLGLAGGLPGKAAAFAINTIADKGTFTADKAAVGNMMGALAGKDAFSPIDAISEAIGSDKGTEAVTVDTGLSSLTSDEDSFEEIDGGIAPQGLASVIAQPPIFIEDQITSSTVNQPVSTISQSVRPVNEPLTVEETLRRARLGGGFNTRQAGGLVSLENNIRTNPVFGQSGGNIGGLMNTGPNVIDVINRGIAMPENIGAVQMQEKIDINQSTPYTSR